jgi:hypothetical protein
VLTSAQLATLKADILADPVLAAKPNNSDAAVDIAAAYNAAASPAYVVWRTDIAPREIVGAITSSEFVALTAIKQNGLIILLLAGTIDGSNANIRAAFTAIFTTGSSLTALTALAKRNATRAEKLFATGSGTTATPSTMAVIGSLTASDIISARSS